MHVEITARRFDASDNLKKYVDKEIARLPKYFDRIVDAAVIMEKLDENKHQIEIRLNVPGKTLKSVANDFEVTKAVDDAVNKIIRQLKKFKETIRR